VWIVLHGLYSTKKFKTSKNDRKSTDLKIVRKSDGNTQKQNKPLNYFNKDKAYVREYAKKLSASIKLKQFYKTKVIIKLILIKQESYHVYSR
jgi:hypothetical protein